MIKEYLLPNNKGFKFPMPANSFRFCLDYMSTDWEAAFPKHCYICHVANADEDEDEQDDTSHCGPHCK